MKASSLLKPVLPAVPTSSSDVALKVLEVEVRRPRRRRPGRRPWSRPSRAASSCAFDFFLLRGPRAPPPGQRLRGRTAAPSRRRHLRGRCLAAGVSAVLPRSGAAERPRPAPLRRAQLDEVAGPLIAVRKGQSQFVFAGARVEHPLVCGVDVVRPPTALRVHGCLHPPSGPRGAFPPPKALGSRSTGVHTTRRWPGAPDRSHYPPSSASSDGSDKFHAPTTGQSTHFS